VKRRARLHLLRSAALLLALAVAAAASAARAECKPTHEIRENGTELRLRADGCALSVAETGAALDALLSEAFGGARMSEARATLELGRIVSYPWLSKALADAAIKSPVWDPKRGRGRRDSNESAIKVIVDTRRLLAPLAPVFARHGAKARASSVEKVLVGEVGDTEALAPLAGQKLAEGKKLPYDAILWLRLEKATTP
jgi:hypothetical protein